MLKALSQISKRFLAGAPIDDTIHFALEQCALELGAERSYLFHYSSDQRHVSNTHEWCPIGIPRQRQQYTWVSVEAFPWLYGQVQQGIPVVVPQVSRMEACAEKNSWQRQGIRSILYVPIQVQGQLYGALGVESLSHERGWLPDHIEFLSTVGELIALAQTQQQQAQLLVMAFDSAGMGAWDWNMITNEESWSPEMSRLLGRDPRSVCRYEDFLLCVHPQDRAILQATQQESCRQRSQYQCEYRVIWSDGSIHWLTSIGTFQYDGAGRAIKLSGVSIDITERKRQEALLHEQSELMRRLIDGAPDLILVKTVDNQLVLANQAVADFYGLPLDDRGVSARETADLDGDLRTRDQALRTLPPLRESVADNERVIREGRDQVLPDQLETNFLGEKRYIRWVKKALPHPTHPQPCILQIGTDITEIKQAEIEQRRAREAAELANSAKSVFLATMSHELRTPLNGILGYAQILRRDPALNARQQEGIRVMESCGHHLLTLINDLLDLAKIEAERLELDPQSFHLPSFIQDIVDMTQIRADQKGIPFLSQQQGYIPDQVLGDAKRLKQVLLNLLSNAIKFTHQGQVSLTLHGQRQENQVLLLAQVSDTGVGIANDQLATIFLPFEQIGDRQQRSEGTGLGLAISQKLIELMGGSLSVTSQVAQGSTFTVRVMLPVEADTLAPPDVASNQPFPTGYEGSPRTILVLDDRPDNRAVLAGLLEPLGFRVLQAPDGKEGLTLAHHHHPDLIISDLIMPVMDGFDFVTHLRRDPQLHAIPAIASSASVMEFNQSKSRSLGFDDFLPKPVQVSRLLPLIQQHLDLTWCYPDVSEQTETPRPLVLPPHAALAIIYEAAQIGHIQRIAQEAHHWQDTDPVYQPFAQHLLAWVEQVDDEAIVAWLQPYLEGSL
ncbi:MAG: hypothetical protein OHK0012_26930 [Synechococcales cyanobacterium]